MTAARECAECRAAWARRPRGGGSTSLDPPLTNLHKVNVKCTGAPRRYPMAAHTGDAVARLSTGRAVASVAAAAPGRRAPRRRMLGGGGGSTFYARAEPPKELP